MREWSKMKIMIFNKKFNFEWMAVSIGTERGEVFIIYLSTVRWSQRHEKVT